MGSKARENEDHKKGRKLEKSYFDVLGLCCTSEVPLIEKILKPLEGVVRVSVIVPSRTVIVLHDNNLISQEQILKALNQARLEANLRVKGETNYKAKWPSPYVIVCGILLSLSFLKYVYHPMQWLAVGAVVAGIWPIILRGVVAIRNFTLDVNILMIIAVVGTIALRDYEEAGTVVFLFTIAEWLESRASQKATAVMSSLLSMTPQKATIAETGEVVNVEEVKLNTIVAVKAGEMIPVDGIVVEGTCEVDEKTLTGESYPVPKQRDSTVWAGTVNVNGYINLKTTALAEDCAVARMAKLVEEAQNKRSNVQRLIDKCATFYTPAVILISAGLAAVPAALKVHNLRHWLYLSLVVLVSACPCGLILSTPVATFCALSRAATTGLLIKGGDYLEILAKIKTIAFDKTGTITRGEFTLMKFLSLADDISLNTLLYWVSSIESKSSHPIASVLVDYGRSKSIDPKPENVEDFQNFPGEGLFGKIDGRDIYIGNKKLAQRAKCNIGSIVGDDAKEQGTSGYIYSNGALIGTFSLSDNCRSGAVDAIRELKKMGIRTALLTGDNQSAAMLAQEQVGNALDVVHAELLPEDKARIITDYKKQGATAMIGDGVNDAPALATADIGISMGVSGSALATETGHVVLMSNDIRKIPIAIKLARKTRNKVIQNIVISITTKAAVLATAFAWHPLIWLAVLVDVGTCLVVIFNSMLLLRGDHTGHTHGRKWFGLFSCHRHKNKCHSTGHDHSGLSQHCCTKPVSPKTCNSARCSSQKSSNSCHTSSNCHTTSDQHSSVQKLQCCAQNASPELCKPFRYSSHDHTAPSQTSCKSHAAEVVHLSKDPHCCSTIASQAIAEPANCFLQDCSSSCKTDKHMNTASQPHKHEKHCSQPNQVLSKSLHCSSHQQCQSKTLNSCASKENLSSLSETHNNHDHNYHQSTCCDEDHCLEALESQVSCDKTDNLDDGLCCEKGICEVIEQEIKPECNHNHSEHSHISSKTEHPLVHSDRHHHEPNTCCEVLPVQHHHHKPKTCCTETVSEISRQDISMHCGSVGVLQDENVVSACKDHCHRPHGNHGAHQHYHGMHRADGVAKHACTSLRKRESGACCKSFRNECCSSHSQGHFVAGFGGLTEIVTE